jgi:hypothetical protein
MLENFNLLVENLDNFVPLFFFFFLIMPALFPMLLQKRSRSGLQDVRGGRKSFNTKIMVQKTTDVTGEQQEIKSLKDAAGIKDLHSYRRWNASDRASI